jgi:hypothetical protein
MGPSVLIVLVVLSLHYAASTHIGRDKAESIVLRRLGQGKYDRKKIVVLDQALKKMRKTSNFNHIFRIVGSSISGFMRPLGHKWHQERTYAQLIELQSWGRKACHSKYRSVEAD